MQMLSILPSDNWGISAYSRLKKSKGTGGWFLRLLQRRNICDEKVRVLLNSTKLPPHGDTAASHQVSRWKKILGILNRPE